MRKNRYTQAVDGLTAPESAVEQMLETARDFNRPRKVMNKRKVTRYAVAAALALVILLGAVIGPGLFGGKGGYSFTMTVHAAELTKDHPVYVEAGAGGMNIVGKEGGGTEYYVALPLTVNGEHIQSVTWSAEKDGISVICPKDSDLVSAGEKVGEGLDTLFDAYYLEQQEKAAVSQGTALPAPEAFLSRKYTCVTLAADKPAPAMALVGMSEKDVSEFYGQAGKEDAPGSDSLAARAEHMNALIGNTIHCTVLFDDGSEQQLDIRVSAAVMQASSADPAAFAELNAEEKAEKDYTGVFVAYSVTP